MNAISDRVNELIKVIASYKDMIHSGRYGAAACYSMRETVKAKQAELRAVLEEKTRLVVGERQLTLL